MVNLLLLRYVWIVICICSWIPITKIFLILICLSIIFIYYLASLIFPKVKPLNICIFLLWFLIYLHFLCWSISHIWLSVELLILICETDYLHLGLVLRIFTLIQFSLRSIYLSNCFLISLSSHPHYGLLIGAWPHFALLDLMSGPIAVISEPFRLVIYFRTVSDTVRKLHFISPIINWWIYVGA